MPDSSMLESLPVRPRGRLQLAWNAPALQGDALLARGATSASHAGWPLSPEVLAALHRVTPDDRRRIENSMRALLDMPFLPRP